MAKTIEIEVKVDSKQAVKGVDELDKSVDELGKSTKKTTESTGELSQGMTGLGGAFGGAINGAKALGKAFLALALNPIGLVIAAIAVAVLAVKTAFTSSEKGQNKYNKLMTVLGSILNNLLDVLANVGEAIIDTFENPRAALDSFVKAIKDNLINRFEGLLELIPQLGKAISALFSGEFAKAGEIAVNAVAKVSLGVEDLTGKIQAATEATKEFIAEAEREARIAAGIADRRARADKIERGLIIERAIANRKIIELRDKAARRDLFNSEERKAALLEALEINEEIVNKEIAAAKIRASAITLENTLSKSNKEALDEEANAKALVIQLETKKLNLQKRLGTELSTINLELAAAAKKEADDKLKATEAADLIVEKELEKFIKNSNDKSAAQDKADKEEIARLKAVEKAKAEIRGAALDNVGNIFKSLASMDEKNKALQAASLIADNAIGIAKTIQSTIVANAKAVAAFPVTAGQPFVTINTASAALGIGSSIAATAKGLAALKKGGSAGSKPSFGGGGGGGSASTSGLSEDALFSRGSLEAPDSETVGGTAGINQQPVQAIVLESDITNTQNRINNYQERSEIG